MASEDELQKLLATDLRLPLLRQHVAPLSDYACGILGFARVSANPRDPGRDAVASPHGYFIVRPQTPSSASRLKAAYYPHPFCAV